MATADAGRDILTSNPQLLRSLETTIGKPFQNDLLFKLTAVRNSNSDVNWDVAIDVDKFLVLGSSRGWVFGGYMASPDIAYVFSYSSYNHNVQTMLMSGSSITRSDKQIIFADQLVFTLQKEQNVFGMIRIAGQPYRSTCAVRYSLGNQFPTPVSDSANRSNRRMPDAMQNALPRIGALDELEIYAISDVGGDVGEKIPCWRQMQWSDKDRASLEQEVMHYNPPAVPSVKILLLGAVGSGKSSFFNTINSVFKGHVTSRAHCGSAQHSVTKKFRTYQIRYKQKASNKNPNFQLCDTMGLEDDQGLNVVDFSFLLDGHVPDGFQFNPSARIGPKSPGFIPSPSLAERMHVICYVIDACSVEMLSDGHHSIKQFMFLKEMAIERDLPIVILLTKIDKLCPLVADDVALVYESKAIFQAIERTSVLTGIPRSHVLPIKNYEHELELLRPIDILALSTLRQIFRYADDYFDNM